MPLSPLAGEYAVRRAQSVRHRTQAVPPAHGWEDGGKDLAAYFCGTGTTTIVSPVGPRLPVLPVAPVSPVLPVAPVAPVAPV